MSHITNTEKGALRKKIILKPFNVNKDLWFYVNKGSIDIFLSKELPTGRVTLSGRINKSRLSKYI